MTERRIDAVFLPSLVQAEQLRGHAVVVIDVLRATSTIITALQNGAAQIIPCGTIEDAEKIRFIINDGMLGGERKGLKIKGFDLGNSPSEYSPGVVGGQTIIMATTNGTPAMSVCGAAKCVWMGGFINAQAIVDRVREEPLIAFLCAGTDGEVTGEDVLFAGCAIERLQIAGVTGQLNDQANLALATWRDACRQIAAGATLAALLANTHGGRNLVKNGMRADIDYCAVLDRFECAPQLDLEHRAIRIP